MRFPQFDNNPKNEHDLKCFESKGNFSKLLQNTATEYILG